MTEEPCYVDDARAVRQHWIPQSYLFPWCDPDSPVGQEPYVWVFDRDSRNGQRRAPKNIFWETHLYSDFEKPEPERFRLERGLSRIEKEFRDLRERKLMSRKRLTMRDKGLLVTFAAIMHGRTRLQRNHHREQFGRIVEHAEAIKADIEQMTPEERKRLPQSMSSSSRVPSISLGDMRAVVRQPMTHVFPAFVKAEAAILAKMNCALIVAESELGFITSDAPCVHHDPEMYRRPLMYRGGLGYRTAEVTLPLTPNLLLLCGWILESDMKYGNLGPEYVDEFNRRTQFYCDKQYVVRRNATKDHWFDPGEIPEDALKAQQAPTGDPS